jgi:hypothetical protein
MQWKRYFFGTRPIGGIVALPIVLVAAGAAFGKEAVEQWTMAQLAVLWTAVSGRPFTMSGGLVFTLLIWLLVLLIPATLGALWYRIHAPRVFTTRENLNRARQSFVYDMDRADICLLAGGNILASGKTLPPQCRILLPDPDSQSVKEWASRLSDGGSLATSIRELTAAALQAGHEVKWFPFFIGQSWWIGRRGNDEFVHIESVIPHLGRDSRPSLRIQAWQDARLLQELRQAFARMWSEAALPPTRSSV